MIATPSKRKYSPPRTRMAKYITQKRNEIAQKSPQKLYKLPSLDEICTRSHTSFSNVPESYKDEIEENEVKVVERPLQMLNFSEKHDYLNEGKVIKSRIPTPQLGFSIKKKYNPTQKQFTFEPYRERKRSLSPSKIVPKNGYYSKPPTILQMNENLDFPKVELEGDSQMIYPDGHISPIDGYRHNY